MPWPMVHFAIANKLFSNNPTSYFLIGSIAPDSIHVREGMTRKDKGNTHLVCDDKLPNVKIIKENCLKYLNERTDIEWKEYILGYFAHIYTDLRWTETIYSEFERNYKGDKQGIREIYNREVSQVEFILLKSEEWSENVLSKLQRANAFTIEPMITQTEVSQYRDDKLAWLRNEKNEPKIEPIYFLEDAIRYYIIETADELKKLFKEWNVAN